MSYKVYGKSNCSYCVKAKNLLEDNSLGYEYIDVGERAGALAYIKSLGATTVPQIFCEGEHIGGYEELAEKLK